MVDMKDSTIQSNNVADENAWTFGQCLATAMISLLLFTMIEVYQGRLRDSLPSS